MSAREPITIIEADVLGITFTSEKKIHLGGVYFRRKGRPIVLLTVPEQRRISIPRYRANLAMLASDWSQGLDAATFGLFNPVSELLSFCEGHHVVFHNITAYGRRLNFVYEGSQRTGFLTPGATRVNTDLIKEFVDAAAEKLRTKEETERSRLLDAIRWINEPVFALPSVQEAKFMMLWVAFENLSALFEGDAVQSSLGGANLDQLQAIAISWLESSGIVEPVKTIVKSRIASLDERSYEERLRDLRDSVRCPLSDEAIRDVKNFRNDLQHRPWSPRVPAERALDSLDVLVTSAAIYGLSLSPTRYLSPRMNEKFDGETQS